VKSSIVVSPTRRRNVPVLLTGKLGEIIPMARDLGFDGIELPLGRPSEAPERELQPLLHRYGVHVAAILTGAAYVEEKLSITDPVPEVRQAAVQRLKEQITFAAPLAAQVILGGMRGRLAEGDFRPIQERWMTDCLLDIVEFAEKNGVIVTIEPVNRYELNHLNSVSETITYVRGLGSARLRVMIDTFHMNIEDVSFSQTILAGGKYISHVHLSDSNRLAPGMGNIDFLTVVRALVEIGYDGYLSCEALPKPDPITAARTCAEQCRALMAHVRG